MQQHTDWGHSDSDFLIYTIKITLPSVADLNFLHVLVSGYQCAVDILQATNVELHTWMQSTTG